MALMDMFSEYLVLKIRVVLLCCLIFFSFFSFVGVAMMKTKAGNCPLYADLTHNVLVFYQSGCSYVLFVSVVMQLVYPLFRIVPLLLFIMGKITSEFVLFSKQLQRMYLSAEISFAFMTFVSACVLSAGFQTSDCSKYPGLCGNWESPGQAAQAGAWLNTFIYVAHVAFGIFYLKLTGNLPFFSSGQSQAVAYTDSSGHPEGGVAIDPALPPNPDISKQHI